LIGDSAMELVLFGCAGLIVLVIAVLLGQHVLSSRRGSGGGRIYVDGYVIGLNGSELQSIFQGMNADETLARSDLQRYVDAGKTPPEPIRQAAALALISATRRWLAANPDIAQAKGYPVP
jgi:hypothetical protein